MGITTTKDLAEHSTYAIRKHFNVVLLEPTVRELRGKPCLELEEFAPTKQQIMGSRSVTESALPVADNKKPGITG